MAATTTASLNSQHTASMCCEQTPSPSFRCMNANIQAVPGDRRPATCSRVGLDSERIIKRGNKDSRNKNSHYNKPQIKLSAEFKQAVCFFL